MPVVVVGLNHKTAPISLLERLTIAVEDLPKALTDLSERDHVLESAVLSTCNRIEVYAIVERFHAGVQDIRNFLSEFCHIAPEDFSDNLYTYHDEAALTHLFRVAAGIDSLVVGESEILGQVRSAARRAAEEGALRRVLERAFMHATRVGRRARTETGIGRDPASISSAAVELARRTFEDGSLADKSVAIVGAGEVGRLAVKALRAAGVADVAVVNRSAERAADLAREFDARPMLLEELSSALADADIVISATTAPATVIDRRTVERALEGRSDRPLFIVDIAVPRDVETEVAEVSGVILRDIEDLRGVVDSTLGSRMGEVAKVEAIISEELEAFMRWERATEIAPTIAALVSRSETLRSDEIARMRGKLDSLSPEQMAAVEQLTKRVVAKLLHDPLEKARELASSKQGHLYLAALRELFELDDDEQF